MKKITIQIKSIFGKILFEYEKENNTLKETLLEAISQNANLKYADLKYADLSDADLSDADLKYADLSDADLSDADLRNADLSDADLKYANLSDADLSDADLSDANLRNADLSDADLSDADLKYANLRNADLRNADLSKKEWNKIKHQFQIIPEKGAFIAYKKLANDSIAMIEIPKKAKRICNNQGRKCRASYIKTLKIWDKNGNEIKEEQGWNNLQVIYKINRLTKADFLDSNPFVECTNGIHFFVTKQEAINW